MAVEGIAGVVAGIVIVAILLGLACIALFIWSLVDILKADNDPTWKILWIVVIALIPAVGVILYYFIGRKQVERVKRRR